MEKVELNGREVLLITEYNAIKNELTSLREWYFYEPKHNEFNALYYEFLEKTSSEGLSNEDKLKIAESYFMEAMVYLKKFYPMVRRDIEPPFLEESIRASTYNNMKPMNKGYTEVEINAIKGEIKDLVNEHKENAVIALLFEITKSKEIICKTKDELGIMWLQALYDCKKLIKANSNIE